MGYYAVPAHLAGSLGERTPFAPPADLPRARLANGRWAYALNPFARAPGDDEGWRMIGILMVVAELALIGAAVVGLLR